MLSFSAFGSLDRLDMQLATSESKYLTSLLLREKTITSPSSSEADLHAKYRAISGFEVMSSNLVGSE
ncbi:hypothetical protein D3C77_459360 [compost metagenome]